jgi:hypothetical protein
MRGLEKRRGRMGRVDIESAVGRQIPATIDFYSAAATQERGADGSSGGVARFKVRFTTR